MKADESEIKTFSCVKANGRFTRSSSINTDDEGFERVMPCNTEFLLFSSKECKQRGAAVQHVRHSGPTYFSSDFLGYAHTHRGYAHPLVVVSQPFPFFLTTESQSKL